jgi:hypothetical protein
LHKNGWKPSRNISLHCRISVGLSVQIIVDNLEVSWLLLDLKINILLFWRINRNRLSYRLKHMVVNWNVHLLNMCWFKLLIFDRFQNNFLVYLLSSHFCWVINQFRFNIWPFSVLVLEYLTVPLEVPFMFHINLKFLTRKGLFVNLRLSI